MPRLPVPPMSCPHCGAVIEAVTRTTHDVPDHRGDMPADGDVTICDACYRIGRYELTPFGIRVRKLRADESWILADPRIAPAVERAKRHTD